jgi:hypothetical protein
MSLTRASASVIKTEEIVGTRNRIINGAMEIDQRNAGAAVTGLTGGVYTIDRWTAFQNYGTVTIQQSTTAPTGFVNSFYTTVTSTASVSSVSIYAIVQNIEGTNVSDFAFGSASAKTITVSFQVRSSVTGTYGVFIRNSAADRHFASTFSISSANTWETKTITIAGDTGGTWLTTTGVGLTLGVVLGAGTNRHGTANTWTASSNGPYTTSSQVDWMSNSGATFYLTGVQLEVGSTATPFERRPFGTELALCQRYLPAIGMGAAGSFVNFMSCGIGSPATGGIASAVFPVSARTAATGITLLQSVGSYYIWTTDGNIKALNALTFYQAGTSGATLVWGAANSTLLVAGGGSNICTGITDIRSGILFTGCEL